MQACSGTVSLQMSSKINVFQENSEAVTRGCCFKRFCKIYRKTPKLESFLRPATFLQFDSSTDVFL